MVKLYKKMLAGVLAVEQQDQWHLWNSGMILGLAQWVKDLVLLQLRHRSQLQLGSDPWPRNTTCHKVAKKEKKKSLLLSSMHLSTVHEFHFENCFMHFLSFKKEIALAK